MTVQATDEDSGANGRIKYYLQVCNNVRSIWSSPVTNHVHFQANNQNVLQTDDFSIDENTGELRIRRQLNSTKRSSYEMVLVARDQGSSSWFETLRFLTIQLVSGHDNGPEFPSAANPYQFFVTENRPRDIRVGRVQASVNDKDPNTVTYYYIVKGNEQNNFYVDKTSGDLYTKQTIDREETDNFDLYILASEQSDLHIMPSERQQMTPEALERNKRVAKVHVTVLDVNDNAPTFDREVYYAGVSAKASINQLITVINAHDADLGANGTVDLIITSSNLYKYGSTKSTGSIVPSPFSECFDRILYPALQFLIINPSLVCRHFPRRTLDYSHIHGWI